MTDECLYCSDTSQIKRYLHWEHYGACIMAEWKTTGMMKVDSQEMLDGIWTNATFNIHYCPMCGKKLGVAE